jgi:hypothetical protein
MCGRTPLDPVLATEQSLNNFHPNTGEQDDLTRAKPAKNLRGRRPASRSPETRSNEGVCR